MVCSSMSLDALAQAANRRAISRAPETRVFGRGLGKDDLKVLAWVTEHDLE